MNKLPSRKPNEDPNGLNNRRVRMPNEMGCPTLTKVRSILDEAQLRRGVLIEMPWTSNDNKPFILTCQWDDSMKDPVWTLYEENDGSSKVVWTQPFAAQDLEFMYDILSMSAGTSGMAIPDELRPGASIGDEEPEFTGLDMGGGNNAMPMGGNFMGGMAGMNSMNGMAGMSAMPGMPAAMPQSPLPAPMPQSPLPPQMPTGMPQQMPNQMPNFGGGMTPQFTSGGTFHNIPAQAPMQPPAPMPFPQQGMPPQPMQNFAMPTQPAPMPSYPYPNQAPQQQTPYFNQPQAPAQTYNEPIKLDYQLIDKRANVLIGSMLVEAGLISEPTLEAALKLQELVRDEKMSPEKAPEVLKRLHAMGGSIDQYLTKGDLEMVTAGKKPDATPAPAPQPARAQTQSQTQGGRDLKGAFDLLQKAQLLTESDITTANNVRKKHGGDLIQILEAAGKCNRKTVDAALLSLPLIREGLMRIDQVIMALNYCERMRVTFDDALDEMGWPNPRKLRTDLPL
ncbi:MAG: hypothetical protein J0H83_07045 [Candidatus Melainabacteria bacterium]|jgi:hypothetical protein|nr:hypothetical protein [Candidatus Melainabacteria bacterium]MBX9672823.1 hypothetical protein [Candidatus Obscuribacterales bacterium]